MGFTNIVEAPAPHICDVPHLADYQPGTTWECDDCGKSWAVFGSALIGSTRRIREWLTADENGKRIGTIWDGRTEYAHHGDRDWLV